jgi:hypothetical protein
LGGVVPARSRGRGHRPPHPRRLAARNVGGESEAAWRAVLDDLVARGLRTPAFLIIDGAAGLEKALAAPWPDVPAQRCTREELRRRTEGYALAAGQKPRCVSSATY